MTQQMQGQQTEPRVNSVAGVAFAGSLVNSASSKAASKSVSAVPSKTTPTTEGDLEAGGSGWAIDLQETLYLTSRHLSMAPTRPVGDPIASGDAPEPNLSRRALAITLLCCLLLMFAVGALDGMQQYARIHAQVDDARSHLQVAASLLRSRQPNQPLDAATLAQASNQLAAAQTDFDELQAELGSPSGVVLLGTFVPRLSSRIATADDLARGVDSALQGVQSLLTASNVILQMRAGGYLDADGNVTQFGKFSPAATLLLLHLHAVLASAAGSLDAGFDVTPTDLALLPSTIVGSSNLVALNAQRASWPRIRAQLLAPDGWRVLIPFVLGTQPNQ